MRLFSATLTRVLAMSALLFVVACDSDDDPDFNPPGFNGNAVQAEGPRGTDVDLSLNLEAEAGIQSLAVSVDGGADETIAVNSGATSQAVTYTFSIPGDALLGSQYSLVFTLTDNEDATSTINGTVTAGKLIDTPNTYAFDRAGSSTVSYGGQLDRLKHVEEIKGLLKDADGGAQITEQALLDMFANTGDNGGGNFTFTSDRQLKNKTFAPDLDDELFEGFFAAAAEASIAGAAGTMAENGTAGLIVRENSGNTILINEKGHEFTQFVEKGLMGAVFLNQIYNTYLADGRIGDDVENTELTEGKNYTSMEHAWDEAFGYFGAPIDFTSNWPDERKSEDRFWANYSTTVDGPLGTSDIIMNAYIAGRAAIVNNDLMTKNEQRDILYENLEIVAAATAVHYINDTLAALDEGKQGEAFHVLSEAWAFTNALRYSPRRVISLNVIAEILDTDFGADGNFWNATPAGLNAAKGKIVAAYPVLAPVQDDL